MELPTLDDIDQELARRDLLSFTTYTMPEYEVNWHHEVMCEYLNKFARLEIKRLMIFAPPRYGKSEIVSRRLPAYILGRNPDAPIITASYGADLAKRMNRDVQRIIDSDEYRRIFPQTRLSGKNIRTIAGGSWLRNSDEFEVVEYNGYYRGAGVGGAITGMGMKWGIIDDPFKNRQDANSIAIRQGVWDWYVSTFRTRLAPGGGILITVTRWHEDGLEARLLELARNNPKADQWTVLSFPAIAEEPVASYDPRRPGEVLWPGRYSPDELEATKIASGSYDWNSLYQQNPTPISGGIFKKHYWRYWKPKRVSLPPVSVRTADDDIIQIEAIDLPDSFDEQMQSWDCSFKDTKTSNFVAGQVWGKRGANKFLLDYKKERLDIIGTMAGIQYWDAKWPKAIAKLIEDKANGPAVIQMLHSKVAGLIAVEPEGGKIARANAVAPEVEAGNVFLPHPALYSWVDELIGNCAAFPNVANDDDVDTLTQALNRMQSKRQTQTSSSGVSREQLAEVFG